MSMSCLEPSECDEETFYGDDGSKTINTRIVNPDGTITFMTTRIPKYSTAADLEGQTPEASAVPYYPTIRDSADSTPAQEQLIPKKRSPRYVASIVFAVLMVLSGAASIVLTILDIYPDSYNYYDSLWYNIVIAALSCQAFSIVCMIISYPLAFSEARRYVASDRRRGLMITGWVFYGIGVVGGIFVVALGFLWDYVYTFPWYSFLAVFVWGLIGWSFMFAFMETARRHQQSS